MSRAATKFDQLERHRLLRETAEGKRRPAIVPHRVEKPRPAATGPWKVYRVERGIPSVHRAGLSFEAADRLAGELRDRSSEADVEAGVNYLARVKMT